jgi:hypothetical protein
MTKPRAYGARYSPCECRSHWNALSSAIDPRREYLAANRPESANRHSPPWYLAVERKGTHP